MSTCSNADKAQIDNFPDRLHYKVTTGFLFMATAILSMEVHFTVSAVSCEPSNQPACCYLQSIECNWRHPRYGYQRAPRAVTQYCWVTGTYTIAARSAPERPRDLATS